MAKKRFSAEQLVALLRQIEVATAQGKSISLACRESWISDQSYFAGARNMADWIWISREK